MYYIILTAAVILTVAWIGREGIMLKFSLIDIFNFYIWGCVLNVFIVIIACIIGKKSIKFKSKIFVIESLKVIVASWYTLIFLIGQLIDIIENKTIKYPMVSSVIRCIHNLKIPSKKNVLYYYFYVKYGKKINITKTKLKRYFKAEEVYFFDELDYKIDVCNRFIDKYK